MGRTIRRIFSIAIPVLLVSACSSSPGDETVERMLVNDRDGEERLFVHHHKDGCQGEAFQTCLQTRKSVQDPWTNFYGSINGFEFEWGYQYELRVRVTDIANPLQDASSKDVSLIEQVQKIKVDENSFFDFYLIPIEGFAQRVSATEFYLGYEINFNCDVSTCDMVASLLTQDMAMILNFQHATDAAGTLRLQGILCSDTPPQFYQSCRGQ